MNNKILALSFWLLAGFILLDVPKQAQAQSRTRLSVEENVVKINGQTARLVSYSDLGLLAESSFDYRTFFATLRAYRVNMVRVWFNYHWASSLSPYRRDGQGRYDIESGNATYYERLKALVAAADAQGIVVQVCLFDANALETGTDDDRRNQRWVRAPFNRANNINGYLATRRNFFGTSNSCTSNNRESCLWSRVNAVVIDKVVESIGNYSNVIYEVMNEPGGSSTGASSSAIAEFHRVVIDRLTSKLQSHVGSKVISLNADSSTLLSLALNTAAVSLYSVHLSDNNGPTMSQLNSTKPIIISNDGHCTQAVLNYKQGDPNRNTACSGAVTSNADTQRANKTAALLQQVFPNARLNNGRVHFDFLDKSLNGSSWPTTTNYEPRAAYADRNVLQKLRDFTF